jgi:hypothetical protein
MIDFIYLINLPGAGEKWLYVVYAFLLFFLSGLAYNVIKFIYCILSGKNFSKPKETKKKNKGYGI